MTRPARVCVIGTGWWATSYHLPTLAAHPHAELVGVADIDPRKAEEAARVHGIPHSFDDHRSLLELGLDGVVVATSHDTHYTLARDALEAGADVLVEKPMTIEPEDARELVRLARRLQRRLHVGYPFPYTRHARALHGLVEEGALGELLTASCVFATSVLPLYRGVIDESMHVSAETLWPTGASTYSDPEAGGGQLLTQVTHCASLLLHLTGWQPRTTFARTSTYDTRVDVWDGIVFKTDTGAVGTITSTGTVALHDFRVEQYRLFGSEGQAVLDTAAGTLRVDLYDGETLEPSPLEPDEIYPAQAPATRLVDAFVGGAPVLVPGELGLLTVELLAAARASSDSDRAVTLALDEALLTPTASRRTP